MRALLVVSLLAVPVAAAPNAALIDRVMAPWAHDDSPGCAVGVVQEKKLTFARGYGMADLEHHVPITADTVFDIASMSKQFTAAAVAMLAAEGKLSLEDDIRKTIPALPALGKITLRDMLHHTSGLRDYVALLELAGHEVIDVTSPEQAMELLVHQRGLDFAPGTKWSYSNTNYFLLAEVVARVAKVPFAKFVRERILDPMKMARTVIHEDHAALVRDRAIGYVQGDAGWRTSLSNWEQVGDGNMLTTLGDLARWDAGFAELPEAVRAVMLAPGKLANGTVIDYGGGLYIDSYRGRPTVGHDGAWAGYRSALLRFPTLATTVIVLCNAASTDASLIAEAVARTVLADKLDPPEVVDPPAPPPPPPPPVPIVVPKDLAPYTGRYHSDELEVDWTFRVEAGELVVHGSGSDGHVHWSGRDAIDIIPWDLSIRFQRGGKGIAGLRVDSGAIHDLVFDRR